jgi:hypothetical protein
VSATRQRFIGVLIAAGAAVASVAPAPLFDALAFLVVWNDRDWFDGPLFAELLSPLAPVALVVALGALGWRAGVLITVVVSALTFMLLAWVGDSESTSGLGFLAGLLLLWLAAVFGILVAVELRALNEP